MRFTDGGLLAVMTLWPLCASAAAASPTVEDKYHVSAAEKIACTRDAMRLCFDTYPDEDKLLSCMKENRASLTPTCRVAFDAGVRRRHL